MGASRTDSAAQSLSKRSARADRIACSNSIRGAYEFGVFFKRRRGSFYKTFEHVSICQCMSSI